MENYTPFDYLCNEPFYVDGVGHIKSPTLRDIRKCTFNLFSIYTSILSMSLEEYLKQFQLLGKYNSLSDDEKNNSTYYHVLLYTNGPILLSMLNFFIVEEVIFDENIYEFDIIQPGNDQKKVGHINADNFELFKNQAKYILGMKESEKREPIYKNSLAKNMFQRLKEQEKKKQQKNSGSDYELDNMIRKYCTHNKVGINILNVWDLTYYQFVTMFNEYCNGRQYDVNDMMAANTFSFKATSDYKPMEYLKNK